MSAVPKVRMVRLERKVLAVAKARKDREKFSHANSQSSILLLASSGVHDIVKRVQLGRAAACSVTT